MVSSTHAPFVNFDANCFFWRCVCSYFECLSQSVSICPTALNKMPARPFGFDLCGAMP